MARTLTHVLKPVMVFLHHNSNSVLSILQTMALKDAEASADNAIDDVGTVGSDK